MEPKPFLNRHARRADLVRATRLARFAWKRGTSIAELQAAAAAAPPRGPCGVRRYSVSNVVRALVPRFQARPR